MLTPEQLNNQRVTQLYHERKQQALQLLGGACVSCGSTEHLEFDHVDPTTKLFNISSIRGEAAWWAEVAKCQILCRPCHIEKSKADGSESFPGESQPNSKLRELDIIYIKGLFALGHSMRAIGRELGVQHSTVSRILKGTAWKHVFNEKED